MCSPKTANNYFRPESAGICPQAPVFHLRIFVSYFATKNRGFERSVLHSCGNAVGLTVLLVKEREQKRIDEQQSSEIKRINDSVTNLRNELKTVQNTLAKHK